MLEIDGGLMTVAEFAEYVRSIQDYLEDVRLIIIHHTAAPDEKTWDRWGGWKYWKYILRRVYESRGWTKGPHLFIGPDGIGAFYTLERPGRAVGGGYGERGVRHIETVGNYHDHMPGGAILQNVVGATTVLLKTLGLTTQHVTNHRRYVGPGVTECPGDYWNAHWEEFIKMLQKEGA